MRLDPRGLGFTVLLGAMAALPPLAIDIGLPALPLIERSLATAPGAAGQTLSLFLAGFAAAQLLLGPLSDRLGRRPVLIAALSVYAAAGFGCAFAPTLALLLAARLIEGAAAASGTVIAFAIVRDRFEGTAARLKMSTVTLVLSIAPIVAPTLGSLLLALGPWRGLYLFLGASGVALLGAVILGLDETAPRIPRRSGTAAAFGRVVRHPRAGRFVLANALNFACMFAYVSGSPGLLITALGASRGLFGALFACTASAIMAGAWLSGELARRRVKETVPFRSGLVAQTATAGILAAGLFTLPWRLGWIMPLLAANTFCRGLVGPNAAHGALEPMPDIAGVASATLGFAQMAAGSAASALVAALFPALGPAAMAVVMLLCAAGALLAGPWRRESRPLPAI